MIALSLRSDCVAISCIPVPRSTATRKTAAAVGSTSDRNQLIPHPVAHALSEELPELRIELGEPRLKDGVACDRFTPHLQERFGYGSALRDVLEVSANGARQPLQPVLGVVGNVKGLGVAEDGVEKLLPASESVGDDAPAVAGRLTNLSQADRVRPMAGDQVDSRVQDTTFGVGATLSLRAFRRRHRAGVQVGAQVDKQV